MNHSQYKSLIEEYATKVKLISNTPDNNKVVTIDELLEKKKSLNWHSPGVVISGEEGRIIGDNIDSMREVTIYSYDVVQYWRNNDFSLLDTIYDHCKKAGNVIFLLMIQDKLNIRKELIGFNERSFAFEKIKYTSDNAFGYRFSFEVSEGFKRVVNPSDLN